MHAAKRIETDISDKLVDCIPTDRLHVDDDEFMQGNFEPGRFGWSTINMRELPKPIPWRGMQSLFDVPDHIITGDPAPPAPQGKLL